MNQNKRNGYPEHQYCGYHYYSVNPSLSIGEIIKKILIECNVPYEPRLTQ